MLKVVHHEAEPNEASGSVLDEIVREAARQMLAVALQAEVSADIDVHAEEVDAHGQRPLTRQPLACGSPIVLPARRRRACRLLDTRFRSR